MYGGERERVVKCPQCKKTHKYSDGMRCGCGYAFVFDPKSDLITDGKFVALLNAVSGPEGRFFTENQLYAQHCRLAGRANRYRKVGGLIAAVVLGAAGILVALLANGGCGLLLICLALIGLAVAAAGTLARAPSRDVLQRRLDKWQGAGRNVEKLLVEPRMHEPPPEWTEGDIYDYGVERVLVVQHDLLVDLFVLNGLAAEEKALVIAESGYPRYLLPVATKMLTETPDLPVLILHDSTPAGVDMAVRLKSSGFLPLEGHPLVDIGLSPDHVRAMPKLKAMGGAAGYEIPADLLLYPAMAGILAASFQDNVGLGILLKRSISRGTTDDRFHYYDSYG